MAAADAGDALRRFRLRACLTQEELAERAGLTARTIRTIETGERGSARLSSVRALADALELTDGEFAELRVLADGAGATSRPSQQGGDRAVLPAGGSPPVPVDFVGRADELGRLVGAARSGSRPMVLAVDGMAGVGKTALAARAAQALVDEYADGLVWLDLLGHTPGQEPLRAAAALDRLLRGVGVSGDHVPDTVEERAALWRARMAQRRAVVVLDNAVDSGQVQPLLPDSPGCPVVVTSRNRLLDLDSTGVLSLDVLPEAEAGELFARVVGDDRAEPGATTELVRLCGRLPLAIRVAGARLRHRPGWTVDHLANRLRSQRLAELRTDHRDVAAVLAMSCRQLGEDDLRMFALLGLHPGADFDVYGVATFGGITPSQADALLQGLLDAHLVQERTNDRYRMHDLVRHYAADLADEVVTTEAAAAALGRLYDWYIRTAMAAKEAITHAPPLMDTDPGDGQVSPLSFDRERAAIEWFDAERETMLILIERAVCNEDRRTVYRLVFAMSTYLHLRAPATTDIKLCTQARDAARAVGDRLAEALVTNQMAVSLEHLGRYATAIEELESAYRLLIADGHRRAACTVLSNLGLTCLYAERFADSVSHLQSARDLARRLDLPEAETRAVNNLAMAYAALGRGDDARESAAVGVRIAHEMGNQRGEGHCRSTLAHAYLLLNRPQQALEAALRAAEIFHKLGTPREEAISLRILGDACRATGELSAARAHWQRAMDLMDEIEAVDHADISRVDLRERLSGVGDG